LSLAICEERVRCEADGPPDRCVPGELSLSVESEG
jgi:hypothetical protein